MKRSSSSKDPASIKKPKMTTAEEAVAAGSEAKAEEPKEKKFVANWPALESNPVSSYFKNTTLDRPRRVPSDHF